MITPKELLAAAAEDMATHGHNKGTYFGNQRGARDVAALPCYEKASACAYGSMWRAYRHSQGIHLDGIGAPWIVNNSEPLVRQAAELLAKSIAKRGGELVKGRWKDEVIAATITTYNDREDVTGEDVILAMKDAANS